MPAVAVVAAYASVSAGVAALGAATVSFGTALIAGAQIAGGVLTAAGALTGNKKLTKIGAVLSLGAAAAGAVSSAASAAELGSAATELTGVANAADAADAAGLAASEASLTTDLASAAGVSEPLGAAAQGAAQAAPAAEPLGGGLLSQASAPPLSALPPTEVATSLVPQAAPLPQNNPTVLDEFTRGDASLRATQAPANIAESGTLADIAARLQKGAGDITDGTLSFIKKNPEAAKLGFSTAGGLLTSYQKQVAAAEQAKLAEQARARYNQSITGQRRI